MEQGGDVVAPARLVVAQLGRMQAKRLDPGTVRVVAQKASTVGLERGAWGIRCQIVDLPALVHKRELGHDLEPAWFGVGLALHRLGNLVGVGELFEGIRVGILDHGDDVDLPGLSGEVGHADVPDQPGLLKRNE